jgi:hypothetical protein
VRPDWSLTQIIDRRKGQHLVASKNTGWAAKLTRPIVLKDGTKLATLSDVRAFILKEPEHIQQRRSWQRAAELLMVAAENGRGVEEATKQIERALFLEARLVLR